VDEAGETVAVASGNRVGGFNELPGRPMAPSDARNASEEWQPRGQFDDLHASAVDTAIGMQDVDRSQALVRRQGREQAWDPTVRQRQDI
jgi:hypothetical protein